MPPIYQNNEYIPPPGSGKPQDMIGIVDQSSEDWFYLGPFQVLIPLGSLTERGRELYEQACRKAETEDPKKVLTDAVLRPISSGMWAPDPHSQHYDNQFTHLNHMTDQELAGKIEGVEMHLTTSKIKWKGELASGTKWVITRSDSLYHYYKPVLSLE